MGRLGLRGIGLPRGGAFAAVLALAGMGLSAASAPACAGSPDFDQMQVEPGYPADILGGGWQAQRRYGYQGPSGVYDCETGGVRTELARSACGGRKFPNRFF